MSKDSKLIKMTVILVLFVLVLSACNVRRTPTGNESDFSSKISSHSETGSEVSDVPNELMLKIFGVSVQPHVVSGKIPSYDRSDPYVYTEQMGALVKIIVENEHPLKDFDGYVLFNGKTAKQLIEDGIISWGNAPDTRVSIGLSTNIPAKSIDVYTLNIVDERFYRDGIRVTFKEKQTSKTYESDVYINYPKVRASRITFTSSKGTRTPDGFNMFIENSEDKEIQITGAKVWKSSQIVKDHWWNNPVEPSISNWFGDKGRISANDMNCFYVRTGDLPFGESIIEVAYSKDGISKKLIYVIKPIINEFDISMGWGSQYLAGSKAFRKTIKLMHFNTVHGGSDDFFNQADLVQSYPMKRFDSLPNTTYFSGTNLLPFVHGSERFGEPQLDGNSAQGIFDIYSQYRMSGYPTTLTLNHEPGYYLYAGLVDYPHFDAYRINAPHADKWGQYNYYKSRNIRGLLGVEYLSWGAPLETIGDYMRTLYEINAPNPVAAWTQGLSNSWSSPFGVNRPSQSNAFETRIQAYQAIANGALSLYWFNMSGPNMVSNRNQLDEIHKINREFATTGSLISQTVPFAWENTFMDIDYNTLAGPDFALLIVSDLRYPVSGNQYVSAGNRSGQFSFKLPSYLQNVNAATKISHSGISSISVNVQNGKAVISDTIKDTGMYIVYRTSGTNYHNLLTGKYNKLIQEEQSYAFNPITNQQDFDTLKSQVEKIG